MFNLDTLLLSPPIPHYGTNGANAFGTSVQQVSQTNCASYAGVGGTQDYSNTNRAGAKLVTVCNLSANVLYVNVGNTAYPPPDPLASSFAIPANGRFTFQVPQGGQPGVHGFVKILASAATSNGSVQWHL